MAYSRTTWVQEETQLNARNMNNIEDGIGEAFTQIETINGQLSSIDELLEQLPEIEEAVSKIPKITSSTTDLIDGTSTLATGEIYLVYEE